MKELKENLEKEKGSASSVNDESNSFSPKR